MLSYTFSESNRAAYWNTRPDFQAHLIQCGLVQFADVFAIDQNLAGRGAQQAGHQLEQGGFAAARLPHDADDLPRLDRQIDVIENALARHFIDQIFNRDGAHKLENYLCPAGPVMSWARKKSATKISRTHKHHAAGRAAAYARRAAFRAQSLLTGHDADDKREENGFDQAVRQVFGAGEFVNAVNESAWGTPLTPANR